MSCDCANGTFVCYKQLQKLVAMEAHLDYEIEELERVYALNIIKLDYFLGEGRKDLYDIIAKDHVKTESLLKMYRPMLEEAIAKKSELLRIAIETHFGTGLIDSDNNDDSSQDNVEEAQASSEEEEEEEDMCEYVPRAT